MMDIPNIIHKSVPIGKDETENKEIEKIPKGKPKVPGYEIFNHAELAERLGGVDFDSARETSGNGFYFLTGDLALLHSAVLNFARDQMIKHGFELVVPPYMIRKNVVEGVMSFEEMDIMMYKVDGEDLYLIGTSEHSMIGRFQDSVIVGKKLPLLLTSFSPCFRKEKGAHGIEEKGLFRVHQFEKQEMIVVCEPEDSYKWYDKMLKFTIDVFRQLDIPVRVLECCSGDLADLKAKSADVEAWSPRQKKYFEVGSCSNLTDAQARRLNIRIDNKGKLYFAHTLNNTVIASPRALIALMENNQQKDGSIKVPKVLWPYMHGVKIIKSKSDKK
jgi:seryl-tRNA synthetase